MKAFERDTPFPSTKEEQRIAVFGAIHLPHAAERLVLLSQHLRTAGFTLLYESSLHAALCQKGFSLPTHAKFEGDAPCDVLFALSFGGDGTFLSTLHRLSNPSTPLLPVNSGHLGFLTEVIPEEATEWVSRLKEGDYTLQQRKLISLYSEGKLLGNAFNEIAIERGEAGTLISVDAWINGDFLAKYRGNGLLIATPSGSTAYSLSLNGPIIDPRSEVLVLTPIAPHTLTLRPMVVPNNVAIQLKVESRADSYAVAIDGKTQRLSTQQTLAIKLSTHAVNILKLSSHSFADVVRSKLLWGETMRGK